MALPGIPGGGGQAARNYLNEWRGTPIE